MATVLYGIKNCDTVRKARRWLEDHAIDYRFHDLRSDGLSSDKLEQWLKRPGLEALLNKRSSSWRQLNDAEKQQCESGDCRQILQQNPTLIKRPVLERDQTIQVGFSSSDYQSLFLAN